MAAFGYPNYTTANTAANVWIQTSATTWPNQPIHIQPATDWDLSAVKAEPDDEFTWLRKRVREVEEMAFA